MPTPPQETKTFHFPHLDAMRGLAALGVLIFHVAFSSALSPVWLRAVPRIVNEAGHVLANGVEVFFVLSGWVIAHSMRNDPLNFASLGRFLVRRALRLTPPYWAALLITMLLSVVGMRLGSGDAFPSVSRVALNFLYLQNLFGVGNIFSPAWTLCIEAQFYVAFAALLGLAMVCGRKRGGEEPFGSARFPLAISLLITGLGALALVCVWNDAALFVSWWFYFAGGALGYLATRDARFKPMVGAFVVAMAAVSLRLYLRPVHFVGEDLPVFIGLLALVYLLAAHGRPQWTEWGHIGSLAWLGRISYSLYLTHFGFGLLLARAFRKIAGERPVLAMGFIVVDMALCLVLAHFFWQWVERPSMRWAKGLKLKDDAVRESTGVAA